MTNLLYQIDSYIQTFPATVLNYDEANRTILLDQTAFYPGGGGQPGDRGILTDVNTIYPVLKARKEGNKILHVIDGDLPLPSVGTKLSGSLNWERSYQLMRTHTAIHILCGVIFRDYGASVTRSAIGVQKIVPVTFADSSTLNPGQPVVAIGNPFGLSGSMTFGIISQTNRLLPVEASGFSIPGTIQIDAAINPGNSGGPVLNMNGEVIGITTAIFSPTGAFAGIGFSVPSNTIKKIIPSLIEDGRYLQSMAWNRRSGYYTKNCKRIRIEYYKGSNSCRSYPRRTCIKFLAKRRYTSRNRWNGSQKNPRYDILGREVAVLVNETRAAGAYRIAWNAGHLPSGVYHCRLASNGREDVKRMVLMK